MLTKKQVFEAALKYAQEQNPDQSKAAVSVNDDFIAGARWAVNEVEAENAELRANLDAAIKVDQFDQYRDEVAKAVQGLLARNKLLTEALLWAIADLETMHDSAGTPPGERHLIEKLKKAVE